MTAVYVIHIRVAAGLRGDRGRVLVQTPAHRIAEAISGGVTAIGRVDVSTVCMFFYRNAKCLAHHKVDSHPITTN